MIREAIQITVDGHDLSEQQMIQTMEQVTRGDATHAQIAALLISLRMKGETADEITGAARVMRNRCTRVPVNRKQIANLTDTCGTGADASGTFNISTVSAIVASGAGITIAKHGNRSITSASGSADVLEALGVPLDLLPEDIGHCIEKVGIGFMFAPMLHSSMKHVAAPRTELGLRTIFNVLGPLTNPAGAESQLLGVFDERLTETMATVLCNLGSRSAFVVHGLDGIDEISLCAPTKVSVLNQDQIKTFEVTPEEFGFDRVDRKELAGGDAKQNAEIAAQILRGEKGPKRDVVVLNTAAALAANGLAKSIDEGIELASSAIESGAAMAKLNEFVDVSNTLSKGRNSE